MPLCFFFFFAGVELTISRQQKKFQHLLPLYCVLGIPRPGHVDLSRGGHLGKLGQRGPQVGFSNLDSAVVPNCCRWLRLKLWSLAFTGGVYWHMSQNREEAGVEGAGVGTGQRARGEDTVWPAWFQLSAVPTLVLFLSRVPCRPKTSAVSSPVCLRKSGFNFCHSP